MSKKPITQTSSQIREFQIDAETEEMRRGRG